MHNLEVPMCKPLVFKPDDTIRDTAGFDLGFSEGRMEAIEDIRTGMCANIMYEIVKVVGVKGAIIMLSRVIGTFLAEDYDPTESIQDQYIADLLHISERVFEIHTDSAVKRVEERRSA